MVRVVVVMVVVMMEPNAHVGYSVVHVYTITSP
jgi:hypothetical protein